MDTEATQDKLSAWFTGKLPDAQEITISPLTRPAAGASNETLMFALAWTNDKKRRTLELVMRLPPAGFQVFPARSYDMARQFQLLSGLNRTNIPAPRACWLEEDTSVIGVPFFIMEKVGGWIPSDFPPYHVAGPLYEAGNDVRAHIWWSAVDALATIHSVDWKRAGLDFLGTPGERDGFIEIQIAYYDEVFQQNSEPMPETLLRARDWLMANSFTPKRLSLCWGDARLGNMVIRDDRVAAVLDWEMACIGDPESDLAWFAHIDWSTSVGRAASPHPRLGGLPNMAETIAYYENKTSSKVENFHYYEVFATYRLSILFTRIEQDPNYLSRSGNRKGFITGPHFEKLARLLDA